MSTKRQKRDRIKKERQSFSSINRQGGYQKTPIPPIWEKEKARGEVANFVKRIAKILIYLIMVIMGYIITNFLSH